MFAVSDSSKEVTETFIFPFKKRNIVESLYNSKPFDK